MDTQLITNSVLIIGILAMGYDRWKSGSSSTARDTISLLKEQNAAKDVKIAEMKAAHDTAIASLQTELNALKQQLDHMKETNIILTNTVTGKETLIAITDILKPIPALFAPGGFIETVRINQEKTLKDLSEIRDALEISPSIIGPKNHKFRKRSVTPVIA